MSSRRVADADEGVSVPVENFSPCLVCLRERLSPQASDLKGDLHDTPRIEAVEALEGTLMLVVRTDAIVANFC